MTMDKLKVAYLTTFYNGKIDGRLGRFHDWVHRLRDQSDPPFDFEVHAFTATNPDETLVSKPHSFLGDGDELWGTRWNKVEFLLNVPRVRRDLHRSGFDLLHIIQLDTIAFPTGSFFAQKPVVIGPDILGWNPIRSGGKWDVSFPKSIFPKLKFRLKQLLAATDQYSAVTAYSDYHQNILRKLGIPCEKISKISPGVDPIFSPGDLTKDSDNPHILYVGDFSDHKGLPTLLAALEYIDRELKITLVGSGKRPENQYPNMNMDIKGFVQRKDLPKLYRKADLFIMPSIDEAGPNTIIESLACGTPVIASDKPGINEYIPNGAGVKFWPRDPKNLAAAIDAALDRLTEFQRNAQSHTDKFHIDQTLNSILNCYELIAKSN